MAVTNPRIRVVHLVLSLGVGGLEKVVLNLVRFADPDAFETRVICLHEPGSLAPQLEALGVPVESLDYPELPKLRGLWRLIRRLRSFRPHIVHTHNAGPHLYGALAARATRVPVVVHTKHGQSRPDRLRAMVRSRLAMALSDCIVPVSEDAANVVRGAERVPERKLRVIRNGIDLAAFPARIPPTAPERLPAIHVGRLEPLKDQATLLRAARRVVDIEPAFRLDIVGDGPSRDALHALARELELGDHVRFLGERNDVPQLLASDGLFVLSSLSEGLSVALLEAMAVGLPTVASDVGGNREIVVPGKTGLLVTAGDPNALADAIRSLWGDPDKARRMGVAGRQRVEEEFDMRQVAARYERLYRELLQGKHVLPFNPSAQAAPVP